MPLNRRDFLHGTFGALMLPMLDLTAAAGAAPPLRLLVVGNPFGMHPDFFFPEQLGREIELPTTLQSLGWLRDRLTILSHTDHGMVSGHGREISFLSGVLPETSGGLPEKNMSIDQLIARQTSGAVRFGSVHATLQRGIRMSWDSNGVAIQPFADPRALFDHLFRNLTAEQRKTRRELLRRDGSILDAVRGQIARARREGSGADRDRLERFSTSVRELERRLQQRESWVDRDKPKFDIDAHLAGAEVTIHDRYHAIFDMIACAFETDLTRVATIAFPNEVRYTDIDGVTRGYHGCTHNGKKEDVVAELVAIESFQIAQLSRCLEKLDAIREPNTDGSVLDHTVVLFGSGMGYGGTHSNRNLPILLAGGGFRHRGHVDTQGANGKNMPLCNLFVTLLRRFGIDRDRFNTSTGAFELDHA